MVEPGLLDHDAHDYSEGQFGGKAQPDDMIDQSEGVGRLEWRRELQEWRRRSVADSARRLQEAVQCERDDAPETVGRRRGRHSEFFKLCPTGFGQVV